CLTPRISASTSRSRRPMNLTAPAGRPMRPRPPGRGSPVPCICAHTAGGARSQNSSWRTEWPGARPRILPDSISESGAIRRYVSLHSRYVIVIGGVNRASRYRNFAPGGRRVTAGDGNMVYVGHIGHPRQAPHGAPGNTGNAGSQHWSRRRGHTHVRTYTRGRAAVDARGGRHDVSRRPQDRHTVGEGRKTNLDPHARGTPALPGDGGWCTARWYSAAA